MSLDPDTIDEQIHLLTAHRRTLAHLLREAAQFSAGHLPAHIASGISETRANISRIKVYLRQNDVAVEDELNDEVPPALSPAATEADRKIAEQRALDAVLETYINRMEELLLDKNLQKLRPEAGLRKIARRRTLTVLRQLDGEHNQKVFQFLQDAELLHGQPIPIVDLAGANLRRAQLNGADLHEADLDGDNLVAANLEGANLQGANLEGANLEGANLQRANLVEANLQGANLFKADLQDADLRGANLQGALLVVTNLQGVNLSEAALQEAQMPVSRTREHVRRSPI
jgi:uncharacterized protein YjbI with pentapeptide repeats